MPASTSLGRPEGLGKKINDLSGAGMTGKNIEEWKTMKIIHTSNRHFGSELYGRKRHGTFE